MHSVTLALPVGFQLDQFRIESVLGKGGFGITYIATDLRLNKKVALKELLPDSIVTRVEGNTVVPHSQSSMEGWEWARERFLDEATRLASFSHPAIVGVHHFLEANGTAYMVMDFVDGESYETRLRRIGREPDEGSLMAVMGPLMDGLGEVHAKGLLHRDIKPDNILINHRGQPILIDFGAAREVVGATVSMTSIVTHGYSPFEQYQGNAKLGPSADIYSLGAVMCRAVTGEKPPVGTERVLEDSFVPLATRPMEGFSIGFLDCIDRALAVRAEYRPQSIAEFQAAIQGQQGTIKLAPQRPLPVPLAKPPAIPTAGKRPGKNPLLPVLAVTTVALVLGAGFWWVLNRDSPKAVEKQTATISDFSEEELRQRKKPDSVVQGNSEGTGPSPIVANSTPQGDFIAREKLFHSKQSIKSGYNAAFSIEDRKSVITRLAPMLRQSKNESTRLIATQNIAEHEAQLNIEQEFLRKTIKSIETMQKSDRQIVDLAWLEFKNEAALSLASSSLDERKFAEGILSSFANRIGYSYP